MNEAGAIWVERTAFLTSPPDGVTDWRSRHLGNVFIPPVELHRRVPFERQAELLEGGFTTLVPLLGGAFVSRLGWSTVAVLFPHHLTPVLRHLDEWLVAVNSSQPPGPLWYAATASLGDGRWSEAVRCLDEVAVGRALRTGADHRFAVDLAARAVI